MIFCEPINMRVVTSSLMKSPFPDMLIVPASSPTVPHLSTPQWSWDSCLNPNVARLAGRVGLLIEQSKRPSRPESGIAHVDSDTTARPPLSTRLLQTHSYISSHQLKKGA